MVETTAILALSSLDRYVTNKINVNVFFYSTWASGSNQLTVNLAFGGSAPVVGSSLQPISEDSGIPAGTLIIDWNPTTNIATINNVTTIARVNRQTLWLAQKTTNYYNDSLRQVYNDSLSNPCNNFNIVSPTSLIYGYISKIIVSQIQLQYNIPTINKDLNDTFYLASPVGGGALDYYKIVIPHGYYYADELAAFLQAEIRTTNGEGGSPPILDMVVSFIPRDGFDFSSVTELFYFPSPDELQGSLDIPSDEILNVYKTLKLLGMTILNTQEEPKQVSADYPNFLYTPYIDIYSDTLTNYQLVKDTNTSSIAPKGLVARIYVSGTGQIQTTGSTSALGTAPFVMTSDLNTPKVIKWTPDVSVTTIDIQLRDCYGDLIPGFQDGFNTEFQMTLLCTEE